MLYMYIFLLEILPKLKKDPGVTQRTLMSDGISVTSPGVMVRHHNVILRRHNVIVRRHNGHTVDIAYWWLVAKFSN